MQPDIIIRNLKVGVNPSDSSYMPSVIIVSGGNAAASSMYELNVVYVRYNDTSVSILSNQDRVRIILFICKKNHNFLFAVLSNN